MMLHFFQNALPKYKGWFPKGAFIKHPCEGAGYTGWLIEILVMGYSNPYTTGWYNPLYNLTNQVFFIAHIIYLIKSWIFLGLTAKEGEKKLFGEVVW